MAVEQDVANRTTANGRHSGDDSDPQQIEALAPRGYGAAYGEHGDSK
jgi:hypothetical protein